MKRQERKLVDAIGLAAAADGLAPIAGRLFGYLLLQAEPVTLDRLAQAIGASKASVSIEARRLLGHGWLERITRPGDRRDWYAMAPDFFARIVRYRADRWEGLHALVAQQEFRVQDFPPPVLERLAYLARAQAFFARGLERLIAEWDAEMAVNAPSEAA